MWFVMEEVKNDCVILLGRGSWVVNVWFKTVKSFSTVVPIFDPNVSSEIRRGVNVDVFVIRSNLPLWFAVIKFAEGCSSSK